MSFESPFKLVLLAVFVPLFLTARAEGQEGKPVPDSTYHISAGNSRIKEIAGERVVYLSGGVSIKHGKITITSSRGVQYTGRRVTYLLGNVKIVQEGMVMEGRDGEYRRARDKATLRGNVRIRDRGWDIRCREASYFRRKNVVWLKGAVEAADSTTTLEADSLYYNRGAMKAEAFGRVRIANLKEGFTVSGKHAFYFRERGEGVVDREPHLVVDPDKPEPAVVVSDTMRVFPEKREAMAYYRVKIIKGETVTQCDSGVVFDEEQRAELYGRPLAKQGDVSMKGTRMVLHYTGSEVDRITIEGAASIREEQADSLILGRDNWILGDTMTLYMADDELDSIRVWGNSTSEYYPRSERRVESNFVRGDSMYFTFTADTLAYVRIMGNSEGVYRYVDLEPGQTCDSLRALVDTSLHYVPFGEKAEKVVYSAKRIEYMAQRKDILLVGKARIHYQNRLLLGKHITYNSTFQLLDARGSPVLIEGQDKFYGSQMDYDLASGVGLVRHGSTKFQQGYYYGEDVAKVGDNILKVWHSTYTTCDLKEPHYHFASKEMKVYLRDKVISGPIWLYIGRTPIAYLPFMANNIRRGRHSGVLRPEFEFGITKTTGRYIRNFGYYWATNDYTDFKFLGDFNEKSSLRFFIENRYKLRYRFNGGFKFSFYRDLRSYRNEWMFNSNHHHNLGEKFTLDSDLRFVSSDKAPRAISRIDLVSDVIDRRIESRVSLRKSWRSVGFSSSMRRVQQLSVVDPEAIRVSTSFPDISLSIPSRTLYFGKPTKRGKKGFWERLLGGIRYSPGVSFRRNTEQRQWRRSETIAQFTSLSFSSPRKIIFINLSPRLSASNSYTRKVEEVDEHTEVDAGGDTTLVPASRVVDVDNVFRWSTGVGARTNFYGTFYPEVGPLVGLRHVISPVATFSYTPKVGSRPSSQKFNLSLTNSIDLKLRGEKGPRKLSNVLIWSLSASYDPKAPAKRGWGRIASRVNLRLLSGNLSVNQSIDPYLGKVLSTQVTSSWSLHGTHPFGISLGSGAGELNVVAGDTSAAAAAGERMEPGQRPGWDLFLSYSFAKTTFGPPRSTLNLNSTVHLTKNWRITYSTTYDVEGRRFLGQNYSIYRDLHCWEMSFSRQKLGEEWQYYFRINVKAHPEIYAESGRRGLGGPAFGLTGSY